MWPDDKLRRDRLDWTDLLPKEEAAKQVAWQRNRTAWLMRRTGMKYREVGERFGVCVERARQMVKRGEREERARRKSPYELYVQRRGDAAEMFLFISSGT